MDELTLQQWLDLPCLPEEVKGNDAEGYYLALQTIKEKLHYMEARFKVSVGYSDFHHFLFNRMDKQVFASGSIQIKISQRPITMLGDNYYKELIGAYSFNIEDYDNPHDHNEQYAGTLKSLCIRNALTEYPQFGANLNNKELERRVGGRRGKELKSHSAIANSLRKNG